MVFRDERWPDGTPSWVDLMVPDQAKAVAFYSALFGWDVRTGGEETGFYGMAELRGRPVAGIGQTPPGQEMPAVWTTYLSVSDVDKTVTAITEAGGQVLMPVMEVMKEGRMAVAADPAGAVFGLWEAGNHIGTQVTAAPGTLAWNECMSRDYPAAKAFYEQVFGFGFQDLSNDDFTYAVLLLDGRPVGGLGGLPDSVPASVPSNWSTYFSVADADASAAKVAELGGQVQGKPFDSPYGRQVQVTDDQGVPFLVIAPNEQSGKPEGWEE
ncbi:VOC family protein [Amycolatopsis sp. FBCC-B4732]|uniref:VOC family protein n=1 Tax=Amycolatopsis sp. FBCC-B4732 TaxID=3079339 RepID=UPI001FF4C0FF|nr:VOC family protein [Amycolatopsis sp. FBCC-B4732]UOX86387.1 VOC family protein [Amycolatopsis sp. FBCC-B4732]